MFFTVILSGLLLAFLLPSIYAQEDEFEFELIFVTSWDECSKNNVNAVRYYESVTKQYLAKNGIVGTGMIDCMNIDDFDRQFTTGKFLKKDLLILIPDYLVSDKYIKKTKSLGHHTYYNHQSDIIVSNSRALLVEDQQSTWTLSHELMHFVIAYKNYGWKYQEEYVHTIDKLYDTVCYYNLSQCPHVYDLIKAPSGKYIPVLKPMPEPEDKKSTKQLPPKLEYSQADPDGDGIINKYDRCDNQRENFNGYQDGDGCPDARPSEKPAKQETKITSTVNGKGLTQIVNGKDTLCYAAYLADIYGNPISNASIELTGKYSTEEKSYKYQKSATTNSYGEYSVCQEPFRFGTTDNMVIHLISEFDGNSKYKPSTSNLATVLVTTLNLPNLK